jgi:AcrR family transcriptional regulator
VLKAGAQTTKDRIVSAALTTLKEAGFAGASARAIAARGGFNQALVFYHFGSVQNLLLAALDRTSAGRMERYEAALAQAETVPAMLAVARAVFTEDLESGHVTVLSELIAGSLAHPELGPRVIERMEPWIDFADRAVQKALSHTPLAGLLPTRDLAFAVVAFYLGIDLLTQLDGDRSRAERLFAFGEQVLPLVTSASGESDG